MTTMNDTTSPKPRNCVELSMEYLSTFSKATVEWSVESASSRSTLATGTLRPDEPSSLACWDEDFECASLEGYSFFQDATGESVSFGTVRVLWNGEVWADKRFDLVHQPFVPGRPLLWIGNECHKHRYWVCDFDADTWLLDVELTTSKDAEEDSIYWRVYSDFGSNGWGNMLHDPHFRHYQPETTYRTLHCLKRSFGRCTEFGLSRESEKFVSNITLRVDGKVKAEDHWECTHELCDTDILTPLRGCWSKSLSNEAIAGIVIAVVVLTPILLVCLNWAWYSARSQPRCNQAEE